MGENEEEREAEMKARWMLVMALAIGPLGVTPWQGGAQSQPSPQPVLQPTEVRIQGTDTIKGLLERLAGREVTLNLTGGGESTGTAAGVETQLVHIAKLRGREFYDPVVPLDVVSSVSVRARAT